MLTPGARPSMLIAGLLLAIVAQAQDQRRYLIEPELWLDGQAQAASPLVVSVDEPGLLIGSDDGSDDEGHNRVDAFDGDWRLEVRARPMDDPLELSQSLWIDLRLELFRSGQWVRVLDSMLGVPEGEVSTLSVADEGQVPTPETAEVYLRLRTQRLQRADPSPSGESSAAPMP